MRKSKINLDQAPAQLAVPARRSSGIGASDIVVLLAMAAAAVALGLGLRLQADYAITTAAGFAAGAFVIAALFHAQRIRIQNLQTVADTAVPGPEAGRERLEPTLLRPEFDAVDIDQATDHAAGQLALAAAALRDADPIPARQAAPSQRNRATPPARVRAPVAREPEPVIDEAAEADGGWAEPGTVDALVRQYAEELDRGTAAAERNAFVEGIAAPKSGAPTPHLPATPPLPSGRSTLADTISRSETAIRKAAGGDVEIHLQPIVAFSDRKARLYEVFPKIPDGKGGALGLADYQPLANSMGLALAIERSAIVRCCAIQRKLSERGRARAMIYRLSPAALRDRAFLQRLLADIKPDPLLTDLIVFEVDQSEIEQGDGVERENMDLLCRAGFRFSLGNAETLALELQELTIRRIGFVRIAASALATDSSPAAVDDLRRGAIESILTGVSTEEQARFGAEFGLILSQGSLFSEPKPLRADVAKTDGKTRAA